MFKNKNIFFIFLIFSISFSNIFSSSDDFPTEAIEPFSRDILGFTGKLSKGISFDSQTDNYFQEGDITPTQIPDNIELGGNGTTHEISSITSVTLKSRWIADSAALVQEYFNTAQFTFYLDGVALPISEIYYSQIEAINDIDNDGDQDYKGRVLYDLGLLIPGTYSARIFIHEHSPVIDALVDSPCYDVGCTGFLNQSITIIVTGAIFEETPTQTIAPPPTNTATIMPTASNTPVPPIPTTTLVPTMIEDLEEIFSDPIFRFDEEYLNAPFRDSGPYIPEFTTNIPSPLDISLEPTVIGTNILLAALLMIPFGYANELLGKMLGKYKNNKLQEKTEKKPFPGLSDWFEKITKINVRGKFIFKDKIKILVLIILYGLIFSFLDVSWNPFSKEGLFLFITMAIVYGIVGLADDYFQWKKIREWGMKINLKFKLSNLLLPAMSILFSRFLFLMPGLMFGTPELLQDKEEIISHKKRNQLLKINMTTLIIIGLGAWILTTFTRIYLLSTTTSTGITATIVSGLEAILLIIFAVVVENYFFQMLGFPGSFGNMLRQKDRKLWFVILITTTFIFIHTLLNPMGDLMSAIQKGNVIVLIGVVATYVAVVLFFYAFMWIRKQRIEK